MNVVRVDNPTYVFTEQDLVDVFTAWERDYRADPDGFQSTTSRVLNETPEESGAWMADAFLRRLTECQHSEAQEWLYGYVGELERQLSADQIYDAVESANAALLAAANCDT